MKDTRLDRTPVLPQSGPRRDDVREEWPGAWRCEPPSRGQLEYEYTATGRGIRADHARSPVRPAPVCRMRSQRRWGRLSPMLDLRSLGQNV